MLFEQLKQQYKLKSQERIADILMVSPGDYSIVSITEIPLSTRANNCVMKFNK